MNTMEMTAAVQTILNNEDCYKKSRMTIFGLAGVLLCENEQA